MRITRETPVDHGLHELLEHGSREFPAELEYLDLERQPGGLVNWHWHEDIQFFLVKEGEVTFRVSRTPHRLQAGNGLFVNSSVLHMARSSGGRGRYYCLNITPSLLCQFPGRGFERRHVAQHLGGLFYEGLALSRETSWQRAMLERLASLIAGWATPDFGWEYRASAAFAQLWLAVIPHAEGAPASAADRRKTEAVSKMMEHVKLHLTERIRLADIARAVGKSPSECCRQFKAVARMTLGEYAEACRVDKARELLQATSLPVARIAEEAGFSSRGFKRRTGMTPAKYRRA